MRKLFLLIPAILLTLSLIADPIGPSDASTTVIGALKTAVDAAAADAVIELSDGIYQEGDVINLNKNITIKAADGAHPVIAQKYYFKLLNNAQVIFQGIKFDGGLYPEHDEGKHASDHCLRAYDDSPTGTLTLEDCEFTRYPSYILYTQNDTRRWGAITIRNCYFHNNTKSAVFITYGGSHQTCNTLTIENSTFADFSGNDYGVIYYGAPDAEHTSSLSVNHCTFYNNQLQAIEWKKSSNVQIKNSIFAQPSAVDQYSVYCVEGSTIDYCLAYKTNGFNQASTNDRTGNPYFMNTNPANYDFTIWTTSPAHGMADDGYDLGDYLRWNTDPATHVATINITADDANSLKTAVDAALPGDQIIMATGTYNESESISLDKNITLKAAADATPTIVPTNGFAISNGAEVTIQNIKFNATSITGDLISVSDENAGNTLTLEGCELYNTGSHKAIYVGNSAHLNTCLINNCYFHNGTTSAVYFSKTSKVYNACDDLTITNSTFANYSGFDAPLIAFYNRNETTNSPAEEDAKLLVDHCTFYNFTKNANATYSFIDSRKSANVTISNCIFANPASLPEGTYNPKASQLYGGTITNCLRYNVLNHRPDDVTPANPIEADPRFTDAANGNFTLKRNYTNWDISPAYGAGTDGSTIGDPRWETEPTYPETDFAAPAYIFTAANAKLSAGTTILETNELAPTHPYIRYTHNSPTGNAEWAIKATRACYVQVTVNMADNEWTSDPSDAEMFKNHKHIFVVEIRDANETLIGSVKECDYDEGGGSDGVATYPTVNLPGYIYIPEAGVYTVKLRNPRNYSRCGVGSVTITYMGGDTQTITNTADFVTDIDDAYFSSNGTRADGKISFSGNAVASEWVRWNVTVANSDYYDITLTSDYASGHIYSVTLYDGETQVARVAESAWHNTTGAIALGRRFLPAGDYVMEVKNSVSSNSDAKIVSVGAVAFVAPVVALPNTLPASSAITSELAYEDGGELYFTPSDQRGHILDQWAKWKVSVDEAGSFLFMMNVTSTNEQSYKITILDSENNELDSYAKNPGSGDQTIKHYFDLAVGNYFVMVQNTTNHSYGHMVSMVVSQPELVTLDEEATSNTSWADKKEDGNSYDVQIIRTIKAGMYNTLCLPFAVSSSQCKEIFGADVQIRTLDEATVDESGFVLNLNFDVASDIYQGTPILIKTSQDIVNPIFVGVQFAVATPSTSTGTNANFIGNFIAGTIEADPTNLFLGAENTLYFPTQEIEILGMRAYFKVHDAPGAPAGMIKRARIVENEQILTDIELVRSQEPIVNSQKHIENGQLIIVRDGVRYNALGIKLQ